MSFLMVFLITFLIVFIWWLVSLKIRMNNINKIKQLLKEQGVNIDKEVIDENNSYALFVDHAHKNWFYFDAAANKCIKCIYDDLLDFELFEDSQSVIKGRSGSAAVGGLLFGGIGALVGASGSKKIKEYCSSMYINIVTNDLKLPNMKIVIIKNQTNRNSYEYKNALNKANEFIGVLKFILANKTNIESQTVVDNDNVERLRNYKQLLDEGVITEEEFEKKKKEILGN